MRKSSVLWCWEAAIFHSFGRHRQGAKDPSPSWEEMDPEGRGVVQHWSNGVRGVALPSRVWKEETDPQTKAQIALRGQATSLRGAMSIFSLEMCWEMASNLFVLLHVVPDSFNGMKKQTVGLVVLVAHAHLKIFLSRCVSPFLFPFKRVSDAPNFLSGQEKGSVQKQNKTKSLCHLYFTSNKKISLTSTWWKENMGEGLPRGSVVYNWASKSLQQQVLSYLCQDRRNQVEIDWSDPELGWI